MILGSIIIVVVICLTLIVFKSISFANNLLQESKDKPARCIAISKWINPDRSFRCVLTKEHFGPHLIKHPFKNEDFWWGKNK